MGMLLEIPMDDGFPSMVWSALSQPKRLHRQIGRRADAPRV
jgi:hypothetical protein